MMITQDIAYAITNYLASIILDVYKEQLTTNLSITYV